MKLINLAGVLLSVMAWGCDVQSRPIKIDESYTFPGLSKITESTEGTFSLKWESVPSTGVVYNVYAAKFGQPFDFTSVLATVSGTNYETDDLRFQGNTCFSVRYFVNNSKADLNTKSVCTNKKALVFSGITAFTKNSDGTYLLTWEKIAGKDLSYKILGALNKSLLELEPDTLATLSADKDTFTTKIVNLGDSKCFQIVLQKGSTAISNALKISEESIKCTLKIDLQDFRGIEGVRRSAVKEATVTWKAVSDPLISGYVVKDLSVLDPVTRAPIEVEVKDRTKNSLVISNIDDSIEHQYVVNILDSNGLRDNNVRASTLMPQAATVFAGPATKLIFSAHPSNFASAGVVLASQPQVQISDVQGLRNNSRFDAVILQPFSDSSCTVPLNSGFVANRNVEVASSGLATFDGVKFLIQGSFYLKASATGLDSVCSGIINVFASNPTKVAYLVNPVSAAGAGEFLPLVSVQIVDSTNNIVQNTLNNVTIEAFSDSLCTVSAPSVLLGGSAVPAQGGLSNFSNLKFNQSGAFYLKASANGLVSVCSNVINVTSGQVSKLAFSTQPSVSGVAQVAFLTQPVLQTQDFIGNLVVTTTSIQLSAFLDPSCSTPAPGVLAATINPLTSAGGISSFTGIKYSVPSTIYIKATAAANLAPACSAAVNVGFGAAAKIAFSTQASGSATAFINFAQQPVAEIQDSFGNKVANASNSVTLTAFTNAACTVPALGTLNGGAGTSASAGLAAFSTLSYSKAETLYLKADTAGLTSVCSAAIAVSPGSPAKLHFLMQPSVSAAAGTILVAQPQIDILDANDNWVQSGQPTSVSLAVFLDNTCSAPASGGFFSTANPVLSSSGISSFSGVKYNQAATVYLKASASGLTSACSAGIVVSPGSATNLAFSVQPSATGVSGTALASAPAVQAQDAVGNLVSTVNPSVTLAVYTDSSCLLVASSSFSAAANPLTATGGISAFSNLVLNGSGDLYLKASASGLVSACSNLTSIAAGAPTQLVLLTQPVENTQSGVLFSRLPVVEIKDVQSNRVTTATNSVTLASYSDSSCTVATATNLAATTNPLPATSGLASFGGVSFAASGAIYIKASAAGLTPVCSNAVNVSAGAASKLAFTLQPSSSATAGSTLGTQPQITVQDAANNIVVASASSVTLAAFTDAGCTVAASGTLSGSLSTSAVGGVASYSGLTYNEAATIYLKASSAGLTTVCSNNIVVSAGNASKLAFSSAPPSTASAGSDFSAQPAVQTQDNLGNLVSATASIQLSAYSDSGCSTPAAGTLAASSNPLSAIAGTASFTNVGYSATGTIYIKASASSYVSVCSNSIVVSPGGATKLAFLTQPSSSAIAGASLSNTTRIEVQDASSNRVLSATNNITLSAYTDNSCSVAASGTFAPGSAAAAVAGLGSFATVSYTKSEAIYIKAVAAGLTSVCSNVILVSPAAAAKLHFLMQPSVSVAAGAVLAAQPQIDILDVNDNWVQIGQPTSVSLAVFLDNTCTTPATGGFFSTANPVLSSSGISGFSGVKYNQAATIYVKATASGLTAACSTGIVVSPGSATNLAFSVQPSASGVSGSALTSGPSVQAQDAVGNLVSTVNPLVTLAVYTNSSCLLAATSSFSAAVNPVTSASGVAAFTNLILNGSGDFYLKASASGFVSACSSVTAISAGAPTQLVFSTQPADNTQSSVLFSRLPIIEIKDAQNNRATTATNSVTLASYSDSSCTIATGTNLAATTNPLPATLGLATFGGVSFAASGSIYIKASAAGLASVCSNIVNVSAGAAAKLAFTLQPSSSATAGSTLGTQPQITVQDAANNIVVASASSVTLAAFTDAGCTVAASGTLSGSLSTSAVGGVASYSGLSYNEAATIYLKATSASLTAVCSNNIVVNAGNASKLAFSVAPPSTANAGSNFSAQPVVQTQDNLGNLVSTTASIQLSVYSDSGCSTAASGTIAANTNPLTATTGTATFSNVNYSATGTIYLKASASGYVSVCSNSIVVSPGGATKIAFFTQPSSSALAGAALSNTTRIEVQDASSNRVITATDSITLSAFTDNACSVAAAGTFAPGAASAAVAGLGSFATVSYTKSEAIYIKAAAAGLASACSNVVLVSPATAQSLYYLAQPSGTASVGSNFAVAPQVELRDAFGNWVSNASPVNVSLSAFSDVSCSTAAGGILGVSASPTLTNNGIAGFASANYSLSGTIYLKATSGSLTFACSNAVVVSAGSATKVAFSTQPAATGTAGTFLGTSPVVQIRDVSSNLVTTASNVVTLSAYQDSSCTTLATGSLTAATNPLTATSGVATFGSVTYTKSEVIYIKASAGGLTSDCSGGVTFTAGALASIRFSTQPPTAVLSNQIFASQPVIEELDSLNNRVLNTGTNVVLSAFTDSACTAAASGTLATTLTVATNSGLSTFTNIKYSKAEPVYLLATMGAFTSCSSLITVSPAASTKLAFLQQPSNVAVTNNNLLQSPQIVVQDASGNIVSSASSSIQLDVYSDNTCSTAASGLSAASNPVSASGGVASFNSVKFSAVGSVYLKASTAGLTMACSNAIAVSAPVGTKLGFALQPSAAVTVANNFAISPWVEVQDVTGARVVTATDSIVFSAFTNSTCTVAAGGTLSPSSPTLSASSGLASFTSLSYSAAGTIYLKATATGLTSSCSQAIVVTAATATQLAFSVQPASTGVVGTNFSVQPNVEVRDAANSRVTTSAVAVTFTAFTDAACSAAAVGSLTAAPVNASAGTATFAGVQYGKSETIYLKATSAGLTSACSNSVQVSPGAPAQLVFFVQPSSVVYANSNFSTSPQIQVSDVGGNWVQTASNVVTLAAFTDNVCSVAAGGILAAGGNPVGAAGGMASFNNVQYSTAATIYLKASAPGVATSACSIAITVNNSVASYLSFSGQPSSTANYGNALAAQPRVDIFDAVGNRVSSATDSVTLAAFTNSNCSTAVGTPSQLNVTVNTLAAANGQVSFSGVSYFNTGTIYLKASSGILSSACSSAVVVSSVAATQLAFVAIPSSTGSAGVNLTTQPIVEVQGAAGQRVSNSTIAITIAAYTENSCTTASGGTLAPAAATNAVAGQVSYTNVNFSQAETIYIKASAAGLTSACSPSIAINAGPVTATLANTPAATSNSTSLSVTIAGTSVVTYTKFLYSSNHDCATGVTWPAAGDGGWVAVGTNITDALGADGTYTLCVKGKNVTNQIQTTVTRYMWTKKTVGPTATIINSPANPSNTLNLSATVSGSSDMYTYQYAYISGSSAGCSGASYSGARTLATSITDAVGVSGQKTLCVKGIDVAGNVQASATSATWTQAGSWLARGTAIVESVSDTELKPRWSAVAGNLYRVAWVSNGAPVTTDHSAPSSAPNSSCTGATSAAVTSGNNYHSITGLSAGTVYNVRVCESTDSGSTYTALALNYAATWPSGQSTAALFPCSSSSTLSGTCTITANYSIPNGVTIYGSGNLSVSNSATLGGSTTSFMLALEGDITVGGATWGFIRGQTVRIVANNVTVTLGEIQANGMGYAGMTTASASLGQALGPCGGYGGSNTTLNSGAGGSHGGMGSDAKFHNSLLDTKICTITSGTDVGNFARPILWGSGGGSSWGDSGTPTTAGTGGNGGGTLYIVVSSTLTVASGQSISADGAAGTLSNGTNKGSGGGGAGGSVWLDVGTLAGSGYIQAKGGAANTGVGSAGNGTIYAGGGGGGRVAIYYNSNTYSGASANINAFGGASNSGTKRNGAAGSLLLSQKGGLSTLTFDNNNSTDVLYYSLLDMQTVTLLTGTLVDNVMLTNKATVKIFKGDPQNFQIGNMTVAANSTLSVDGDGHVGGVGIANAGSGLGGGKGNSTFTGGLGGSHGGEGGVSIMETNNSGHINHYSILQQTLYGSAFKPVTLGSGGGSGSLASGYGGAGGGAVHLVINGTLSVDGTISSKGLIGYFDNNGNQDRMGGGGAGGSIWLEVATLTSSSAAGKINAEGAPGNDQVVRHNAGGGGRIALYYNTFTYTGEVSASGGSGFDTTENFSGGPGSVFKQQRGVSNELSFSNKSVTIARGGFDLGDVTGLASSTLDLLSVKSTGAATHMRPYGTQSTMSITNANVESGSSINLDGLGYLGHITTSTTTWTAAQGTGAGASYLNNGQKSQGGAHGGLGGVSPVYVAENFGKIYGNPFSPVTMGSGGGGIVGTTPITSAAGNVGGSGGGALKLTLTGTLTLNGRVSSNGMAGDAIATTGENSGGAGGSVWLTVPTITGTGSVQANGGIGNGMDGGGGGGRVALYYTSIGGFSGSVLAAGGFGESSTADTNVQGNFSGGPGTIFYAPSTGNKTLRFSQYTAGGSDPTCTWDNCFGLLDMQNWSYSGGVDVEIRDNAQVYAVGPQTGLTINNLTVRANSKLSAKGLGYLGSINTASAQQGATNSRGLNGTTDGATTTTNKSGSGGAHAGIGGNSNNNDIAAVVGGTATYGAQDSPITFGSGGGGSGQTAGTFSYEGLVPYNNGGGALYLTVQNVTTVENTGFIEANGRDGVSNLTSTVARTTQGGGAGGSVWLVTNTLTGAGVISTNGGTGGNLATQSGKAGGGGGGGGGRVSVSATTTSGWSGTYSSAGGAAGAVVGGTFVGTAGALGSKRLNGANAP